MRDLDRALLLSAMVIAPLSALVAATPSVTISEAPSWTKEASPPAGGDWGFAPLSVTQSGVAYSPVAPPFDPATSEQPKIADLPAWASSYFATGPDRSSARTGALGVLGFGALPEPAAWALILIGTAMICGALRGLIMAHRRLDRLRDDDEAPE